MEDQVQISYCDSVQYAVLKHVVCLHSAFLNVIYLVHGFVVLQVFPSLTPCLGVDSVNEQPSQPSK